MEKSDHVLLTLSTSGLGSGVDEIGDGSVSLPARKSLRRMWNQLPRCQRNLIILAILGICATVLLFLPGDQIVAENDKEIPTKAGFPFHIPARQVIAENDDNGKEDSNLGVGRAVRNSRGGDEAAAPNQMHPNDIPQFVEQNLQPAEPQLQPNVENVAKFPDTDESNNVPLAFDENMKPINIQEINDNNIESPAAQATDNDYRAAVEEAVLDPFVLPSSNGRSIQDLMNDLDTTTEARKHHFHGATNERQDAIVTAFKHSWDGYKKYAWGHDNLKPLSQSAHDWFGLGLTIVDSLDTMYIMGLEDEFLEARNWVAESLTFNINREVNLFEVTIRVMGGLLSSYHLSGDTVFLKKSIELGNRLLPCFLTPSGIPYSDVNLGAMTAHAPKWSPDSSTSEVTTIQLEFRELSRLSNTPLYEKVVNNVNLKVHSLEKNNGLVPIFINTNTGNFRNYATISMGARGDSYYEYLLKQWLQTGRRVNDYLILDYMRAIDGVLTQLMRRTPHEQHVYLGELINGKDFKPKMDHLTCYLPGTLILGHKYGMPDSHLILAKDLLETCYQTYMKQPTHLAPEITYFAVNDNEEQELYVKPNDAHNLLRPEFIESLYYFYAITGNRTYQDMGWNIFQAFEKHTKVASGYTSIGNVKNVLNTRLRDMMESFWLGETLKYFYLLFSDDRNEIDLEKWVFNTEAHPLPIRNSYK